MQDLAYRNGAASAPIISLAIRQAFQSPDGLLDRLPIGICTCDRDGVIIQYNRRAAELWGYAPAPGDRQTRFCATHKAYRPTGEPLPPSELPMAEVLRTGEPVRDREIIIERPDGTRLTILANLDPLFDRDGDVIGGVNCFQDISERKRTEEMVRESERRTRELLEALPAAIYTTDAAGRITFYNQAAADLAGRRPELGTDEWCVTWRLYSPDGTPLPHDQCPMAVALKENRPVRGAEATAEKPDGTRVPFIPYPTPLRDASGALIGAVNMLVDITERKQAEARQKTLVDELNHRVKNTLATVQSLAAQTLRGDGVSAAVRDAFEGRLFALSQVHDQLTRQQWESADLRQIADAIFAPYMTDDSDRLRLRGDPVQLGPHVALMLSMALHELATNAAKYGALSAPTGTLTVAWSVAATEGGRRLWIEWQESGGPIVQQPTDRGFGTRLVERGIREELKGSAQLAFEPAGLHCRLEIPLFTNGL